MTHMQTLKQFLTLLFLVTTLQLNAQDGLYREIQAFKEQDSLQAPPKAPILFVGSSSFRLWKNVQADFPGYPILNRGFGGSTLPDVIKYADDIIFPYSPKQIVIYCGENDIASDAVTAQAVLDRLQQLFTLIRKTMHQVPIAFVAMKPSPSREKYHTKLAEANQLIKNYLAQQTQAAFIDIYPLMLENGKPDESLYLNDRLHMNAKGYAIWQKAILPYLKK